MRTEVVSEPALKAIFSCSNWAGSTIISRPRRWPKGGTAPLSRPVSSFNSSVVAKRKDFVLRIFRRRFVSSFLFAGMTHRTNVVLVLMRRALAPMLIDSPLALADSSLVGVGSWCLRVYVML